MKAVRLIRPGHPLELQAIPLAKVGAADVLVRVKAAGICHSDAHYRAGRSAVHPLPLTLGHEVAGIVEEIGPEVSSTSPGARVCLHYLATCGQCHFCRSGNEQFCPAAQMLGKHRDGGYAECIVMPERSIVPLPAQIPFEQGAILMCSSATALHALHKAQIKAGDTVAVFGVGGLGSSAIQLARILGAREVFAVDIRLPKLKLAEQLGAVPVNGAERDPVEQIKYLTDGRGVDVALELIGLPVTIRQAIQVLAIQGRTALAGITAETVAIAPYAELINKEASVVGVSDHLKSELPRLIQWVAQGQLALSGLVTRVIPLDAAAINDALDRLESFGEDVRTVIVP